MKSFVFACFLFIIAISASAQPASFNMDSMLTSWKAKLLNKPFPAFTAKAPEGIVSNDLFKNKVVLINFWFETCHGCMQEMKSLNALYDQFKNNNDFLFVSFTRDDAAAIRRVRETYSIAFKVLQTSNKECSRLMIVQSGYPTTMILDKTGAIRYLHGTYDFSLEKSPQEVISTVMPKEIQSLLQEQ